MPLEQDLNTEKEYFRIPRDVLVICVGKSTYARCGIIVNVTPLEPEWEGHVTLEFSNTTPLLGAIPELDSMAVVALITGLEDRFGFSVDDDEIEGSTFATLGSLIEFVDGKLAD